MNLTFKPTFGIKVNNRKPKVHKSKGRALFFVYV